MLDLTEIKQLILTYRRILIILFHLVLITIAYLFAFYLRFDFNLPQEQLSIFTKTVFLLIVIKVGFFYYFGIFQGLWRYMSINDLLQILKATTLATICFIVSETFIYSKNYLPRSIFLLDWILCIVLLSGIRFLTRLFRERYRIVYSSGRQKRVLIVGAGQAGILMLKEYQNNPSMGKVIGFIDDDQTKNNCTIYGKRILGNRNNIAYIAGKHHIEEIILAIPSARGDDIRSIVSFCRIPDIKLKIIPDFQKILRGELEIKAREVRPDDLLGREIVTINEEEIFSYVKNKKVLVTGAGGSIGSELCRQIVRFSPKEIILFDHNENDVYFLTVDFKTKYPNIKIKTVIGDIRDVWLLKRVFSRFNPQVIFHAAAHKHVPLLEENPVAAVKNNVIGTRNLIYAAHHYHTEKFVFISTDKAVNPANVMGMSKRIAEMILQAKAKHSMTRFMAVRFGNVIGSAGSVVPLFKRQIEQGGPITVTHPESKRYVMSVKEAAALVLQAGGIGKGGEIFILDMGEQIKIIDIAKDLITLSGLVLDKDVSIKFIGLRQGEKLAEELLLDKEKDKVTKHDKIFISNSDGFDVVKLRKELRHLEKLANIMNEDKVIRKMKEIISLESA